jgi:hypothetical protein
MPQPSADSRSYFVPVDHPAVHTPGCATNTGVQTRQQPKSIINHVQNRNADCIALVMYIRNIHLRYWRRSYRHLHGDLFVRVVIVEREVFPGERLDVPSRWVDFQRLHGTQETTSVIIADVPCETDDIWHEQRRMWPSTGVQEVQGSLGRAAAGSGAAPSEARRGWCRHAHRPAHAQIRPAATRRRVLSCTCAGQATVRKQALWIAVPVDPTFYAHAREVTSQRIIVTQGLKQACHTYVSSA